MLWLLVVCCLQNLMTFQGIDGATFVSHSSNNKGSNYDMPKTHNSRTIGIVPTTPRRTTTATSSTLLFVSSTRNRQKEDQYDVVSSRVIKNIPLPILIYYIKSYFRLPTNLPMPYEDVDEDDDTNTNDTNNVIRTWYCPLSDSNDSDSNKLFIEVIGLRTREDEVIPSMAMVAIKRKKKRKTTAIISPLLEGTHKLLIRALDCAIDDLLSNTNTQEQLKRHFIQMNDETTNDAITTTATNIVDTATTAQQAKTATAPTTVTTSAATDAPNDIISYYNNQKLKQQQNPAVTANTTTTTSVAEEIVLESNTNTNAAMASMNIFDENPFLNITNMKELLQADVDDDEEDYSVTPKELAKQVMEFGQQQKQEEQLNGLGFAETAFATAKELIKQQKQLDYGYKEEKDDLKSNPSKEQEELRKIFQAGEQFAELKIASENKKKKFKDAEEEEEEAMERLINSDKTVPRASANDILEHELAELQVRMRVDPYDDSTTIPPGGVFDLFEGPRQQQDNDNDPAMSINWPGASSSSSSSKQQQQQKLPSSLEEAITQAKFASQMLLSLTKSSSDGKFYHLGKEIPVSKVKLLCKCVEEAVEIGIIANPFQMQEEKGRLELILQELSCSDDNDDNDLFTQVVSGFKDLFLSDNFAPLVRQRLDEMAQKEQQQSNSNEQDTSRATIIERNEKDRTNLSKIVQYSMVLLKETQSVGAELEAMQLEIIRSICEVAMDPRHGTEEEAVTALSDAVRDMRPLLDENFVAYLKYAIMEEEGRLKRRGRLDNDDESSQQQQQHWLMVLKVIQGGVYAELSKTVQRHIDTIMYVLRMDTKVRRRRLLELFVNDLPSLDVRPFRKVVDNIVGSLGMLVRDGSSSSSPEYARVLGGLSNPILQLASDIKDVLPPKRITQKAKDADNWVKAQRKKIALLQEERRERLVAKKAEKEVLGGASSSLYESDPIESDFD